MKQILQHPPLKRLKKTMIFGVLFGLIIGIPASCDAGVTDVVQLFRHFLFFTSFGMLLGVFSYIRGVLFDIAGR